MTKNIFLILLIILSVTATFFLLYEPVLINIGRFLMVQEERKPGDLIHVIAGPDVYTDHAVRLFHEGYGKSIFFTGGWCSEHGHYHGLHSKEIAVAAGVPPRAIIVDDSPVTSTYSEVVRLREFMNRGEISIRSIVAVSDPYHMRRARWTYRHVLGDEVELHMAPIPFELSLHQQRWWTDRESRTMVKNEYLKMLYYYARYKYSRGRLEKWLASLDKY